METRKITIHRGHRPRPGSLPGVIIPIVLLNYIGKRLLANTKKY